MLLSNVSISSLLISSSLSPSPGFKLPSMHNKGVFSSFGVDIFKSVSGFLDSEADTSIYVSNSRFCDYLKHPIAVNHVLIIGTRYERLILDHKPFVSVSNVLFMNCNSMNDHGGAIFINSTVTSIKVTNCRFFNCSSYASTNHYVIGMTGGAVYLCGVHTEMHSLCFTKCSGLARGFVFIAAGPFQTLVECSEIQIFDCGKSLTEGIASFYIAKASCTSRNTNISHTTGSVAGTHFGSGNDHVDESFVNLRDCHSSRTLYGLTNGNMEGVFSIMSCLNIVGCSVSSEGGTLHSYTSLATFSSVYYVNNIGYVYYAYVDGAAPTFYRCYFDQTFTGDAAILSECVENSKVFTLYPLNFEIHCAETSKFSSSVRPVFHAFPMLYLFIFA